MARWTILAVGRLKSDAEKQLYATYARRLGTQLTSIEIPESRRATAPERLGEEAGRLKEKIPKNAACIVLDERGENIPSRLFSDKVMTLCERTGHVVFIIGGPDGLDAALKQAATWCVSFGSLTWPHRLVRIMCAEQLYRARSIAERHPYHRE